MKVVQSAADIASDGKTLSVVLVMDLLLISKSEKLMRHTAENPK